jgi:hypothetical protein
VSMRRTAAAFLLVALVSVWAADNARAQEAPNWAPASEAAVHPGVQTVSPEGQCTANFVFYDATNVYIGQSAHCTGLGASDETDGCRTGSLPLGTQVQVRGASQPGTLVYSSWLTMQAVGEKSESVCNGNDFALVRLSDADRGSVNPSIPFWGGPEGIDGSSSLGEPVYGYGNSGLRAGISALSPKTGFSTGQDLDGWSHNVYTLTPGIPGDSGSAYLGSDGGALGVLSTIEYLPRAASNNVTDLSRALSYMKAHTALDGVVLANGTEEFAGLL